MIRILSVCCLLAATACTGDESVASYGTAGKIWALTDLDGNAFRARATLEFAKAGRIVGQAPCNRFSTRQSAPYPWFKIGPIAATKMACQDLSLESDFFSALEQMTLSEVSGDTLILSNDAGRAMVFTVQ